MTVSDRLVEKLELLIAQNKYEAIETEKLELKDLSTPGKWDELYKTVCAFLNTEGGIVAVGISENPSKKTMKVTAYNSNDEPNIKNLKDKIFTDSSGLKLDLSAYFPSFEIREICGKQVAFIFVEKLPEDEKYVFFKQKAYKRILTGDHQITDKELKEREELKEEFRRTYELTILENCDDNLLNLNKLNQYITRLNAGKQVETLKTDLKDAASFLNRKHFVKSNKMTLLGMLVCGDYPEDYIPGKCEADCYVSSEGHISDKQVFKANIIELIEQSYAFIRKSIRIGISYQNSGTAVPEYPEEIIRETINNALAHRDYKSNRFIIIEIEANKSLLIRNPGSFRETQRLYFEGENGKIRRIIPVQWANNPRLTDLLKSFDRWEGKGKGLASLTNACLQNRIDLPYFILGTDEIKLYIPTGKVLDDEAEIWLNAFSDYIFRKAGRDLEEEEKIVLTYFYKSEKLNRLERYTVLLTADNNHSRVIAGLEEFGLLFKAQESPQIYPVYLTDRVLAKTNFSEELNALFGEDYKHLDKDHRESLQTVYQFESFAKPVQISANFLANAIFIREHGRISDVGKYEIYRRRIRRVVNYLEKNGFIVRRGDKPDFIINQNYLKNLFS